MKAVKLVDGVYRVESEDGIVYVVTSYSITAHSPSIGALRFIRIERGLMPNLAAKIDAACSAIN